MCFTSSTSPSPRLLVEVRCHRRDVATPASARWRGGSTPSTRRRHTRVCSMAFRIKRDAGLEQTPRSRRPRTRRGLPPTTARTAGRAANTSSTTHRSAASTTRRGSCAGPRAARARARARRCPPGRSRSIIKRTCRRSSGRRGRVPYPLRCRPPPGTRLCGFVVGGPIHDSRNG